MGTVENHGLVHQKLRAVNARAVNRFQGWNIVMNHHLLLYGEGAIRREFPFREKQVKLAIYGKQKIISGVPLAK